MAPRKRKQPAGILEASQSTVTTQTRKHQKTTPLPDEAPVFTDDLKLVGVIADTDSPISTYLAASLALLASCMADIPG